MAEYIRKFQIKVSGFKHTITENTFLIAVNYYRYKRGLLGTCFVPRTDELAPEILRIMHSLIVHYDEMFIPETTINAEPTFNAQRLELNGRVNVKRMPTLELNTTNDLEYRDVIRDFVVSTDFVTWKKNNADKVSRLDGVPVGRNAVRVAKQISIESSLELSALLVKHGIYEFIEKTLRHRKEFVEWLNIFEKPKY